MANIFGHRRCFAMAVNRTWPRADTAAVHTEPPEQGKVKPIDVRMDDIEVRRPFRNRLQQQSAGRIRIDTLSAKAECAGPHSLKLALGSGIAAGKEGDVMSEIDEFIH